MPGEAEIANFSCLLGRQKCLHHPAFCEHAVRIVEAKNFVVLQQVNVVSLRPFQVRQRTLCGNQTSANKPIRFGFACEQVLYMSQTSEKSSRSGSSFDRCGNS